jgi:hypothetical protein
MPLVNDSEYSQSAGAKPLLSPSCIYLVSPGERRGRRSKPLLFSTPPDQLRAVPFFLGKPPFELLLLYQKIKFFQRGYIDLRMHEEGIRVD